MRRCRSSREGVGSPGRTTMRRALLIVAVAASLAVLQHIAWGGSSQSAYKPAERRRQEQEKDAQKSKDAQEPPDTTYEQELQAAKEKRDKDLQDAAANETSPRSLEKRKQEIFAQYAAILAALRDKYQEAHPDDPNGTTQKAGKGKV